MEKHEMLGHLTTAEESFYLSSHQVEKSDVDALLAIDQNLALGGVPHSAKKRFLQIPVVSDTVISSISPVALSTTVETRPHISPITDKELQLVLHEDLTAIIRGSTIEKCDVIGTVQLRNLDNGDATDGFEVKGDMIVVTPVLMGKLSINPKLVEAGFDAGKNPIISKIPIEIPFQRRSETTSRELLQETLSVLRYSSTSSLRPVILRAQSIVKIQEDKAIVTIQVLVNPAFQTTIDSMAVQASFSTFTNGGAEIADVKLRPVGFYNPDTKILSWSPISSSGSSGGNNGTFQLDALLQARSTLNQAIQSVPIVVKGTYCASLISGADFAVENVQIKEGNIGSRICKCTISSSKTSKFEYRFL